jgi:hypothetical protein
MTMSRGFAPLHYFPNCDLDWPNWKFQMIPLQRELRPNLAILESLFG